MKAHADRARSPIERWYHASMSKPIAALDNKTRKRFKQIAHHLDPVVIVGDQGLSDGVLGEVDRALTDHELIKVRISFGERSDRETAITTLVEQSHSQCVQKIGKVVVLYRGNDKANPKLSNLVRFASHVSH